MPKTVSLSNVKNAKNRAHTAHNAPATGIARLIDRRCTTATKYLKSFSKRFNQPKTVAIRKLSKKISKTNSLAFYSITKILAMAFKKKLLDSNIAKGRIQQVFAEMPYIYFYKKRKLASLLTITHKKRWSRQRVY